MSVQRECFHILCNDGKGYLFLANQEYGGWDDCTAYGPFENREEIRKFLWDFSNPGGCHVISDGKQDPPTESPNGMSVEDPKSWR